MSFDVRIANTPERVEDAFAVRIAVFVVEQQIPLRRLGTPDEVAKIIYVLCTETSSYVNGAEIHINGGQHV